MRFDLVNTVAGPSEDDVEHILQPHSFFFVLLEITVNFKCVLFQPKAPL